MASEKRRPAGRRRATGVAALVLLAVAGCASQQQQDQKLAHELDRCGDEARETFRAWDIAEPEIVEHIRLCMAGAGYAPRSTPPCQNLDHASADPACFQPKSGG
jgi:hypothetical protein